MVVNREERIDLVREKRKQRAPLLRNILENSRESKRKHGKPRKRCYEGMEVFGEKREDIG